MESNVGSSKDTKSSNTWGNSQQPKLNLKKPLVNKRLYFELNDPGLMKNEKEDNTKETKKDVSISDIKNLIKNPKQFIWIYGVELGYHLPPNSYITWGFIITLLKGKIKLVKSKSISLTIQVPKLEQLSMRRIWPKVQNLTSLVSYMPFYGIEKYPPRKFFFKILHTRYRHKFDSLLREAKEERKQEMIKANQVIKVDSSMLDELQGCSIWNGISSSQEYKKVNTLKASRMNQFTPDPVKL
jgi:hypothetical protein